MHFINSIHSTKTIVLLVSNADVGYPDCLL